MDRPATHRTVAVGHGADWGLAEEVPVEIGINGRAWTVMMATPDNIEDLAIGIALTEQAITDVGRIDRVEVKTWPEGLTADIQIPVAAMNESARRRRTLDGRSGCGLCGVETLAEAIRRPAPAPTLHSAVSQDSILRAFDQLAANQVLNNETRSVHAAAWCLPDGQVDLLREDVGRHNALDKLVGGLARSNRLSEDGFIIMSSRCSFELVCKAAMTQASLLATVSAPTGLALDLSQELGLPLACRSGKDVIMFNRTG